MEILRLLCVAVLVMSTAGTVLLVRTRCRRMLKEENSGGSARH